MVTENSETQDSEGSPSMASGSKGGLGRKETLAFLETYKSLPLVEMEFALDEMAKFYGKVFLKRLKEAYKGKL